VHPKVNERIAELAAHFDVASGPQAFVCECSQPRNRAWFRALRAA
jgi:hypothetical protein